MLIHAVDQYGEKIILEGRHPRKELLEALGAKHADKMYRDYEDGDKHVGYIVDGRWFAFYVVTPWERPAPEREQ